MGASPASLEDWWVARWSTRAGLAELLEALADAAACLGRVDNIGSALVDLRLRALPAPPLTAPPPTEPDPWGEGRPVPADDPRALMGGLAPELLFGCRREAPEAAHVWSLGLCLLSALLLADVGRVSGPPPLGADAPGLRALRVTLIHDVHRKKPGMFAGRRLPQQEFLYPDGLPESDQVTVERALASMREAGALVDPAAVLGVLTAALQVSPGARTPTLAAFAEGLRVAATACRRAPAPARSPAPPDLPSSPEHELRGLVGRVAALEQQQSPPSPPDLGLAAAVAQLQREAETDRAALVALRAQLEARPAPQKSADWVARIGVLVAILVGVFAAVTRPSPTEALAPKPTSSEAPRPASKRGDPADLAEPTPSAVEGAAPSIEEGASEGAPLAPSAQPSPRAGDAPRSREPSPRVGDGARAEAVDEPAAAVPGRLVVRGGTATLSGAGGAADPSRVAPGAYRLRARTSDGKDFDLGTVNVGSGSVISVVCGFGTCRRE